MSKCLHCWAPLTWPVLVQTEPTKKVPGLDLLVLVWSNQLVQNLAAEAALVRFQLNHVAVRLICESNRIVVLTSSAIAPPLY